MMKDSGDKISEVLHYFRVPFTGSVTKSLSNEGEQLTVVSF